MSGLVLRPLAAGDLEAVEVLLAVQLGGRLQARLGAVVDVLAGAGVVALADGELVGVATEDLGTEETELRALAVAGHHQGRGLGGRLVETLAQQVATRGSHLLWLVTTNDNLDALRLYQRHGFHLAELHPAAVEEARRRLKPGIPATGQHGIPLRDELVLQRTLRS